MHDEPALRSSEVIRLVAGREIRERMRAKSFLIGTGLLVVVILAVGVVSRLVGDDGPAALAIGVVSTEDESIVASFEATGAALDRDVTVTFFVDGDAARAAVADGDVAVAVDPQQDQVVVDGEIDEQARTVVQQAWSTITAEARLAEAGLGVDEIEQVMAIPPLDVVALDGTDDSSGLEVLTGTVAAVLLFMLLQTFGTYVLTGVVEEKSSAVVEILLVRARADQLLAGKVIGIGVAALAQFSAAVGAGLVSLAISGIDVPGEIWTSVPMMLVWFLGGFALYSTLFALAGSLVSRQEDARSAAAPISYGLIAAYLLVFVFGYVPDSPASVVLSLLPPFAPFLMPMRMAAGAASAIEVAIAIVGMVTATIWVWKLSSRIYEQVLLRRGSRIGWRQAFALLRR